MRLMVSLLPSLREVAPSTDIAVVIDVLRATSVMATALANGAERVITCENIAEAEMLGDMFRKHHPLLCGERGCRPIDGFDLGNSPAEYKREVVQDRPLVLTTTNGTHAIGAAGAADRIITASFLNLSAVVEAISHANEVHLVCAGTEGAITTEDTLLAGAIVEALLAAEKSIELVGDEPRLARQVWQNCFGSKLDVDPDLLAEQLADSQGGRNLVAAGYQADLRRCANLNSAGVVPERTATAPNQFQLPAKTRC